MVEGTNSVLRRLTPTILGIEVINAAVSAFSRSFAPSGPILDIGSYYQLGYEQWCDRRVLFPGLEYVGCDIRPGPGVDRIENAQQLTFSDSSVGAVILLETLEHLPRPKHAVMEARRVLRDDGLLLLSVPFSYRLHGFPTDYWRFTASGIYELLGEFPWKLVFSVGPALNPATIVAIAANTRSEDLLAGQQNLEEELRSQAKPLSKRLFWCALHQRSRDLIGLLLGRAEISVRYFDPGQADYYLPITPEVSTRSAD
jgi:SAM-dependent methyltransferase